MFSPSLKFSDAEFHLKRPLIFSGRNTFPQIPFPFRCSCTRIFPFGWAAAASIFLRQPKCGSMFTLLNPYSAGIMPAVIESRW